MVVGGGLIGRVAKLGESIVASRSPAVWRSRCSARPSCRCCPRAPSSPVPFPQGLHALRPVSAAGKEAAMNRYPLWKYAICWLSRWPWTIARCRTSARRLPCRSQLLATLVDSALVARAAGHHTPGIEADFVQLDGTLGARALPEHRHAAQGQGRDRQGVNPDAAGPDTSSRSTPAVASPRWLAKLHTRCRCTSAWTARRRALPDAGRHEGGADQAPRH